MKFPVPLLTEASSVPPLDPIDARRGWCFGEQQEYNPLYPTNLALPATTRELRIRRSSFPPPHYPASTAWCGLVLRWRLHVDTGIQRMYTAQDFFP
jgi:hypothetical protein